MKFFGTEINKKYLKIKERKLSAEKRNNCWIKKRYGKVVY